MRKRAPALPWLVQGGRRDLVVAALGDQVAIGGIGARVTAQAELALLDALIYLGLQLRKGLQDCVRGHDGCINQRPQASQRRRAHTGAKLRTRHCCISLRLCGRGTGIELGEVCIDDGTARTQVMATTIIRRTADVDWINTHG